MLTLIDEQLRRELAHLVAEGRPGAAMDLLERLAVDTAVPAQERALALSYMAGALIRHEPRRASEAMRLAEQAAVMLEGAPEELVPLIDAVVICRRYGDRSKVHDLEQRTLRALERPGAEKWHGRAYLALSVASASGQRWHDAAAFGRRAVDLHSQPGYGPFPDREEDRLAQLALSYVALGDAALGAGTSDQVGPVCAALLGLAASGADPIRYRFLAQAALFNGDWPEFERYMRQARESLGERPEPEDALQVTALHIEACIQMGSGVQALALVDGAIQLAEETGYMQGLKRFQRIKARLEVSR